MTPRFCPGDRACCRVTVDDTRNRAVPDVSGRHRRSAKRSFGGDRRERPIPIQIGRKDRMCLRQCRCPGSQHLPAGASQRVDAPRGPVARRLPSRRRQAIAFEQPKRTVETARIHAMYAEPVHPLQEVVPMTRLLPDQEKQARPREVPRQPTGRVILALRLSAIGHESRARDRWARQASASSLVVRHQQSRPQLPCAGRNHSANSSAKILPPSARPRAERR